jgi:hypothetical protein
MHATCPDHRIFFNFTILIKMYDESANHEVRHCAVPFVSPVTSSLRSSLSSSRSTSGCVLPVRCDIKFHMYQKYEKWRSIRRVIDLWFLEILRRLHLNKHGRQMCCLHEQASRTNDVSVRDETSTRYSSVPCVAKTAVQYWQWTRDVLACQLSIWFPTVYGSNERTESVPSISCHVVSDPASDGYVIQHCESGVH